MPPASAVYLEWLCRRLHVTRPVTSAESSNGEFGRTEALQPFEVAFDIPGRFRGVVATGAAYHRLLHLRPFPDGNGRIGRLMVYALLARLGVRPDLWPLSRGLARRREEYDAQVDAANALRTDSRDGEGPLSQEGLLRFCRFFLSACLEQVRYQESVLAVDHLLQRIQLYCAQEATNGQLPRGAFHLLRELVLNGEVDRARIGTFVDSSGSREERIWSAQRMTAALLNRGLIVSDAPRAPFRLGLSGEAVDRWFPALYPTLSRQMVHSAG
jgi:Fic family protein